MDAKRGSENLNPVRFSVFGDGLGRRVASGPFVLQSDFGVSPQIRRKGVWGLTEGPSKGNGRGVNQLIFRRSLQLSGFVSLCFGILGLFAVEARAVTLTLVVTNIVMPSAGQTFQMPLSGFGSRRAAITVFRKGEHEEVDGYHRAPDQSEPAHERERGGLE